MWRRIQSLSGWTYSLPRAAGGTEAERVEAHRYLLSISAHRITTNNRMQARCSRKIKEDNRLTKTKQMLQTRQKKKKKDAFIVAQHVWLEQQCCSNTTASTVHAESMQIKSLIGSRVPWEQTGWGTWEICGFRQDTTIKRTNFTILATGIKRNGENKNIFIVLIYKKWTEHTLISMECTVYWILLI